MKGKQSILSILLTALMVVSVLSVGAGSVAAQPAVTVSGQDAATTPGSTVTVSFTVDNTGSATGAILDLQNVPSDWTIESQDAAGGTWSSSESKWLWQTIDADNSKTVSVTFQVPSDTSTADYDIDGVLKVTGQDNQVATSTVSVESGPKFDVTYDVDKTSADPGESITVTADVTNNGAAEGSTTVDFKTGAETFASKSTGTLAPGDATTVSATTSFDTVGTFEVYVNELSATTVTVTQAPPENDVAISPNDNPPANPALVFQGQTLLVEGLSPNTDVQLRRGGQDSSQYIDAGTTDAAGFVRFGTDRPTGDYLVRSANGEEAYFELVEQDLSVSSQFASVTKGVDDTNGFTVTTNRPGQFDLTIGAANLSQENLLMIFDSAEAVDDSSSERVRISGVTDGQTIVGGFPAEIATGDYTFDFSVTDTTADATSGLTVTATGAAAVSFGQATVSEQIGDEAAITVDMENTQQATLIIGSAEAGYQLDLTVSDGGDDGTGVTVLFNTYAAGRYDDVAYAASPQDSVTVEGETSLDNLLASGSYTLRVADGTDVDDTISSPARLGSVSLPATRSR
jgi:hypothetical protein